MFLPVGRAREEKIDQHGKIGVKLSNVKTARLFSGSFALLPTIMASADLVLLDIYIHTQIGREREPSVNDNSGAVKSRTKLLQLHVESNVVVFHVCESVVYIFRDAIVR